MTKKIALLLVTGAMALSLVIVSCGPADVPQDTEGGKISVTEKTENGGGTTQATTAPTETPTQEVVVEDAGPKYGGTLYVARTRPPTYWDDLHGNHYMWPLHNVQQRLLVGDWTRGPAGTGEFSFENSDARFDTKMGQLAESWEVGPDGDWTFHIRRGIHYAVNPEPWAEASRLVNGRELTAEDIAFAINRLTHTDGAYIKRASPQMSATTEIKALDKYTLEINTGPDWALEGHYFLEFYAYGDTNKEVIEQYGGYEDWRNNVGTGPFYIKEYVPDSSITQVKNPNYFGTDPVGPGTGNQAPYLNTITQLIIPDTSTQLSALRTGRIAYIGAMAYDDAQGLFKTSPDLEYHQGWVNSASMIGFRMDLPEKPYLDVKVRRAMTMAVDYDSIIQNVLGGLGQLPAWPMVYQAELSDWWLPLDQAPVEVQELYEYNPEKAQQLLTEAGYPDGFKATVVVNASGTGVDELSIIKDMWAKAGIDLTLDVKENAVFTKIQTARNFDDMIYASTGTMLMWARGYGNISSNTFGNPSHLDEVGPAYIAEARAASQTAWLAGDYAKQATVSRELLSKVLADAYCITYPQKPTYNFWWPWLKNFEGAMNVGAFRGPAFEYMWIDQNLKKSMGH